MSKGKFRDKILSYDMSNQINKDKYLLEGIEFKDLELVELILNKLQFTEQDLNKKFDPKWSFLETNSPLIYALVKKAPESIIKLLIDRGVKITSDVRNKDAIQYFTGNPDPVVIKKLIDTYNAPIQKRHIQDVDDLIQRGKNQERKEKRIVIRNMLRKKMLKDKAQKKLQSSEVSPNPKTIQSMKDLIKKQLGIQQQQKLKQQILELATIMNLSSSQKKKMWEDFLVDYYTKQSQGIPLKKWLWAWWKKIIKKFTS